LAGLKVEARAIIKDEIKMGDIQLLNKGIANQRNNPYNQKIRLSF
jgi:hypothetical protein